MPDALDFHFTVRATDLDVDGFTHLALCYPGVDMVRYEGSDLAFNRVPDPAPAVESSTHAALEPAAREVARGQIEGILFGRLKDGADVGVISAQVMNVADRPVHVLRRVWCREPDWDPPLQMMTETFLAVKYFDTVDIDPGMFCYVSIEVVEVGPTWPVKSLDALQSGWPRHWNPTPTPEIYDSYMAQVRAALVADPIVNAAVEFVHSRSCKTAIPVGSFKPLVEAVLASGLQPASETVVSHSSFDHRCSDDIGHDALRDV